MADNELARLVRRATQGARLKKDLELVAFVGLGLPIWERYGLVEGEQRKGFEDALLEAGTALGLAFLPASRDAAGVAAKRTHDAGYGRRPAGEGGGARDDAAHAAKQRALRTRDGYRAAAARRAARDDAAPPDGLPGEPSGEGGG